MRRTRAGTDRYSKKSDGVNDSQASHTDTSGAKGVVGSCLSSEKDSEHLIKQEPVRAVLGPTVKAKVVPIVFPFCQFPLLKPLFYDYLTFNHSLNPNGTESSRFILK